MAKSGSEYDEVFEELMFYGVVNINNVRSRSDIADQLRFDNRIGFMRNRGLFIDKMLDTFPAKILSSGKLLPKDYNAIENTKGSLNKNTYKSLVNKRFKNTFEQSEQDKDYIMVEGYSFNKRTKLFSKVNARLDLIKLDGSKRVVLRDLKTGQFVRSKDKKKKN